MEGVYGISWRGIVNYKEKAGIGTTQPLAVWNLSTQNIGAVMDDSYGIFLSNPTLAKAGTQQYSPSIVWQANGWRTNAVGESQDVRFRIYALPAEGAANPTNSLVIQSSINGAAYTTPFAFTSAGNIVITNGIVAPGIITWGATPMGRLTSSGSDAYIDAAVSGGGIIFRTSGTTQAATFTSTQRMGIGATVPTARLHLPAGTASASTAPFKFTSGTNLTTAEAGAMEYNGTNLFFTRAGTTREGVLTQSAVTTEVVVTDTTVTVNIGGTTFKLLAKA